MCFRDFPIRGIQFYDGPINVQNCTFRKFAALDGRHTSALAFRLNNAWQSCPNNNVTDIHFEDVPVSYPSQKGFCSWLGNRVVGNKGVAALEETRDLQEDASCL